MVVLSANTLKGDTIRNHAGEELGHLEEIVLDTDNGRIAYAVLAAGGFLGLGDKFFAIPWDMVSVDTESRELILDVEKEKLKDAPGFDKDNWPGTSDRSYIDDVYRYYERQPYQSGA